MWPPDLILRAIDTIHVSADLPWWVAIGASTVVARTVLMPLAMYGTLQQGRMQAVKAELAPLQLRVQQSGGLDSHAAAEMHAVYQRHGINPMRLLALPLIQLPVFMSFFLGLRRLAEAFPDAHAGGAYWFVDLGANDTSLWLPAASGISALTLVRLSLPGPTEGMSQAEADQADLMKHILSAVTLVSLPVAGSMPASVLCFWITNNCISLLYTLTVQSSVVRAAVGLPPMPGPRDPNAAADAPGAPPPLPPVSDEVTVNRAQMAAANSLSDMAASMYAAGKLDDAVAMQARAVAVRDVARAKLGGGATEYAGAAVDAQALRDALWKLREWQEQLGQPEDAADTLERWHQAGGVSHPAGDSIEAEVSEAAPPSSAVR